MSKNTGPTKSQQAEEWKAAALKDTAFVYFDVMQDDGSKGYVTAAYRLEEDGTTQIAFSFCSPKDRFCKAKGREMAAARLHSRKTREKRTGTHKTAAWTYHPGKFPEDTRALQMAEALCVTFNNHEFERNVAPQWLKGRRLTATITKSEKGDFLKGLYIR